MRTLRTRMIGLLGALVATVAFAGAASASSVSLVWVTPGGVDIGNTLDLGTYASATVNLDIRVTADPVTGGVQLASVSLSFDNSLLFANSATECPAAPGNGFAGFCGFPPQAGDSTLTPIGSASINNPGGTVDTVAATSAGGGLGTPGNLAVYFTLGRINFTISGSSGGDVVGFYNPLFDGLVPVGGGATQSPTITGGSIIPEPGTFALLGLGLGTLAFAGRRRR